jgi:hypothetical protein
MDIPSIFAGISPSLSNPTGLGGEFFAQNPLKIFKTRHDRGPAGT